MKISKLRICNFKLFRDITIKMNSGINIFVGENDSGKTTILEAISMVLTGRLSGGNIANRLNLDWFNIDIRNEYRTSVSSGCPLDLPSIEIEAFFSPSREDEVQIKRLRGTNNSFHEDSEGVKIEISFDSQYSETYRQLLSEGEIKDIPIEYYHVIYRSFANPDHYLQTTAKRVAFIDTTKKDYGPVLNRFISGSINEYLTDIDVTNLRHAYRSNRHEFTENQAIKSLNKKLQESHSFDGKTISLNLRETEIDEWKNDISVSLDSIPLDYSGFGTQNMFKSELFLQQNAEVDILIIEEPENNLSFANMSILVSKISANEDVQVFISTHSSFVANKLGLNNLHLVALRKVTAFSELKKDTYDYFLKLPGYNTLRVLLAKKAILVEGPADELILQRAYIDHNGKLPIEDGIDVVSVGGLAFSPYCELMASIGKHVTVVTDNDGDHNSVEEKFSKYGDLVLLCTEQDDRLNTLEPSVLSANLSSFELFKSIVYQGADAKSKDTESIREFMRKNKTTWAMRVFTSSNKIEYPSYILKSIGAEE